jgi:hypothetical protein
LRRNLSYFCRAFLGLIYINISTHTCKTNVRDYGSRDAIKCGLLAVALTVPILTLYLVCTLRKSVLEPTAKPSHTEARLLCKVLE